MYERFTDRARKVMQLANQEAQRLDHEYASTEHILLGLVAENSGVAAGVLKNLGLDLRKIRLEVERSFQPGPSGEKLIEGRLPCTLRAKQVIEYATEEARNLRHNYVGTEHLLLGLLREREGVAAQIFAAFGVEPDTVRKDVRAVLTSDALPGTTPHIATRTSNVLAELTPEQLQLVHERVRHLNEQKDVFTATLDFTLAARCRGEAEALTLLLAWYVQARESR